MTAGDVPQARPRRRPEILASRSLLRGTARVHLLFDPQSGAIMELSPKTHFVLDRMDGARTLEEIGSDYQSRFGTRLGEPQWQQLLGLFYGRGLLVGAQNRAATAARQRSSAVAGRISLVPDAPALIDRLHRATGFARRRLVLVPLLVLLCAFPVELATQLPALDSDAAAVWHRPWLCLAVFAAIWVSMGLHEFAHAVVGRAAGGRVTALGLRWRLPMAYFYCEVQDIRFLPSRRHQAVTALAGVLMNLAVLLPVWLAWVLLGRPGPAHPLLGALLLLGAISALFNLLPLPPLDGYRLLEYLLGATMLASETRRFVGRIGGRLVRQGPGIGSYDTRSRLVYGGYAVCWIALTGALSAYIVILGLRLGGAG